MAELSACRLTTAAKAAALRRPSTSPLLRHFVDVQAATVHGLLHEVATEVGLQQLSAIKQLWGRPGCLRAWTGPSRLLGSRDRVWQGDNGQIDVCNRAWKQELKRSLTLLATVHVSSEVQRIERCRTSKESDLIPPCPGRFAGFLRVQSPVPRQPGGQGGAPGATLSLPETHALGAKPPSPHRHMALLSWRHVFRRCQRLCLQICSLHRALHV